MTGGSHVIVGISTIVGIGALTGVLPPDRVAFGMVILGSVLPDIDGGGIIVNLIPAGRTISKGIKFVVGHRGVTHWLLIPVILMCLGMYYSQYLTWLGIGYVSHILADSCTVSGVPLLAPFSKKSYGLRMFRTGGVAEWFISATLVVGIVYFGAGMLIENVFNGELTIKAYNYTGVEEKHLDDFSDFSYTTSTASAME